MEVVAAPDVKQEDVGVDDALEGMPNRTMRVVDVQASLEVVNAAGPVVVDKLVTTEVELRAAAQAGKLCVASWRWDLVEGQSKQNVGRLLRQAAVKRCSFLAVDCVSVDQEDAENKMANVVTFQTLYSVASIPVVLAYQTEENLMRPWIIIEAVQFKERMTVHEVLPESTGLGALLLPWGFTRLNRRITGLGLTGNGSDSTTFFENANLYWAIESPALRYVGIFASRCVMAVRFVFTVILAVIAGLQVIGMFACACALCPILCLSGSAGKVLLLPFFIFAEKALEHMKSMTIPDTLCWITGLPTVAALCLSRAPFSAPGSEGEAGPIISTEVVRSHMVHRLLHTEDPALYVGDILHIFADTHQRMHPEDTPEFVRALFVAGMSLGHKSCVQCRARALAALFIVNKISAGEFYRCEYGRNAPLILSDSGIDILMRWTSEHDHVEVDHSLSGFQNVGGTQAHPCVRPLRISRKLEVAGVPGVELIFKGRNHTRGLEAWVHVSRTASDEEVDEEDEGEGPDEAREEARFLEVVQDVLKAMQNCDCRNIKP